MPGCEVSSDIAASSSSSEVLDGFAIITNHFHARMVFSWTFNHHTGLTAKNESRF